MKYIVRAVIDGFQSHAHTELAFTDGLNVIVGPSDQGKSAALRAIRWCLYNEPRGTEFVRNGTRNCKVALTMSDGAEIVREVQVSKAGKAERNQYTVALPGQAPQVFEGFGTKPPAEVIAAHGMPEVKLDTDKAMTLNIASQLEGPFLLSETGSFASKALGRLLGVHVVDAAIRDTQRDSKGVKAEVGRQKADIERIEAELKPFDDVGEQCVRVTEAERLLGEINAAEAESLHLQTTADKLRNLSERMATVQATIARTTRAAEAGPLLAQAEAHQRDCTGLQTQRSRLERIATDLAATERKAARLAGAPDALDLLFEAARIEAELRDLRRINSVKAKVIAQWTPTRARLKRYEGAPAAIAVLDQAEAAAQELAGLSRMRDTLQRIETDRQRVFLAITTAEAKRGATSLLEAATVAQQEIATLTGYQTKLATMEARIDMQAETVAEITARHKDATERHTKAIQGIRVCPTCHKPIDAHTAAQIAKEMEMHAHG